MRPVLFIENDDSFSWNVVECLPFARRDIVVCARRALDLATFDVSHYHAVVVGPGPTDPVRAGLVAVVRTAADRGLPLLGICLGHQALGMAFGAQLVRTTPTHGKPSPIEFHDARLFAGLEAEHVVMRYHSLSLAAPPPPLRVVAHTHDGLVMAIEHERLPMAGLQFHPDSYGSPSGRTIVAAFFRGLA